MKTFFVVLLTALSAFGQQAQDITFRTTGPMYMYVAAAGSDAKDCRTPATACATFQGALNKAPHKLRHGISIIGGCGSFPGFYVDGFETDPSYQLTTGGLQIEGTWTNSTPATGAVTGTATGGTAGSGSTRGTLVDSTGIWTTNDFTGKYINILTGTGAGQIRPISSNNGTTISIVGTWTAPVAGSTYAIQEPCTLLTTATGAPPTGGADGGLPAVANQQLILVFGNQLGSRSSALKFQTLGISNNAASSGIVVADNTAVTINFLRTVTSGIFSGITNGTASSAAFTVNDYVFNSSQVSSYALSGTGKVNMLGTRVLAVGGAGLLISNVPTYLASLTNVESQDCSLAGGVIAMKFGVASVSGSNIDCTSNASMAMSLGVSSGTLTVSTNESAFGDISTSAITDCKIGVLSTGSSRGTLTSVTGTAATNAVMASWGGTVQLLSGNTLTGTTAEYNLDNGASANTFASITGCTAPSTYGSRVCK